MYSCRHKKSNKKKVIEWVANVPHAVTFRDPHWVRPYDTFAQWEKAGQKLKDAEKILLELYGSEESPYFDFAILEALGCVGSEKSITLLIETIQNKSLDSFDRQQAVWSIGRMAKRDFNMSVAVEPLCEIVSNSEETIDIRTNAIRTLSLIGDKKAIPIIEKVLESKEYPEFDKKQVIIPSLEKLKGRTDK